jgi:hypothetical protein
LDSHVDEVGVQDDSIGRAEGGVVGEEEVAGLLRKFSLLDLQDVLSFLVEFLFFLQSDFVLGLAF